MISVEIRRWGFVESFLYGSVGRSNRAVLFSNLILQAITMLGVLNGTPNYQANWHAC